MIKIYVADLASYNSGFLVGEWIDLPLDEDVLTEKLKAILAEGERVDMKHKVWCGEHEELAIHDYETELDIKISEYSNIHDLNELAQTLEDMDNWKLDDLKAVKAATGYGIHECIDIVEEGRYTILSGVDSTEDLGQYVLDEGLFGIEIPDSLLNYIDVEAIGRDWEADYTIVHELQVAVRVD